MRFLSLRQQLLFGPEGTSNPSVQPLGARHGAAGASRPGPTTRTRVGRAEAVRTPAISSGSSHPVARPAAGEVAISPDRTGEQGEQLRSLFELAGAGIMLALFLVAAIFA